jgi:urease accessory protein
MTGDQEHGRSGGTWDLEAPLREGDGVVELERVAGRTAVRKAEARSPLRLLLPRGNGEAAWVVVSGLGGGLVDGDAVRLRVTVGAGAKGVLTTQGATKAYRSPNGSTQQVVAHVGDRGLLALVPDPLVPFAGARLVQSTRVSLSPGGAAVVLDTLTAGRVGMAPGGERWAMARLESRLVLERAGEVVVDEALLLDPAQGSVAERMGRFDVLSTLLIAGHRLEEAAAALVASVGREPLERRAELVVSASPLRGGGAVVRVGATSVERAMLAMKKLLGFLPDLLGDDPFRGKW